MEPNDIISQAIETNLSSTNQGNFSDVAEIGDNPNLENPANDVDIYKFQLNAGDTVTIDVDEIDPELIPLLTLFDSDTNQLDLSESEVDFNNSSELPSVTSDPFINFTDGFTTGEYNIDISVSTNEEVIFGTDNSESLSGTLGDDVIIGRAGNDRIFTSDGINLLYGNAGDDFISGGSKVDNIFAGEGNDTIKAAEGDDDVRGESGDDIIFAGSGDDIIEGGQGDDTIFGAEGDNQVIGDAIFESGNDIIYTGSGNDLIEGGLGNDTIWLGGGDDLVILESGAGTDVINNFQLGQTKFAFFDEIDELSIEELSFNDGASGAEISFNDEILAIVSNVSATTLTDNIDDLIEMAIEPPVM